MKHPLPTVLALLLAAPCALAQSSVPWQLVEIDGPPTCLPAGSRIEPAAGRPLDAAGELLLRGEFGFSAEAVGFQQRLDGIRVPLDPQGRCDSNPLFLNDVGQAAGLVDDLRNGGSNTRMIWRYTPGRGIEELTGIPSAVLPAFRMTAFNDRGDVAGATFDFGGSRVPVGKAWLWRDGAGWSDLSTLHPDFANGILEVLDLNDRGDLVLRLAQLGGVQRTFVAPAGSATATELSFAGSPLTLGTALGADGTAAGIYRLPDASADHAFAYSPRSGLFDIHNSPFPTSAALYVHEAGASFGVLGTLADSNQAAPQNVFSWDPASGMQTVFPAGILDLLLPAGGTRLAAFVDAVNGQLDFVVSVSDGNRRYYGFQSSATGLIPLQLVLETLSTETFDIRAVHAVNAQRDILLTANATSRPGAPRVLLLLRSTTPLVVRYGTGEPGTGALTPDLQADPGPLGGTATLRLRGTNQTGTIPGALLGGFRPGRVTVPGIGTLLVDVVATAAVTLPPRANSPIDFSIPNDPALSGQTVCFQLLHADPGARGGIALSNALALRLGL